MPRKDETAKKVPEKKDAFGAEVKPARKQGVDPFVRDSKAEKEREAEKFGSPFSE